MAKGAQYGFSSRPKQPLSGSNQANKRAKTLYVRLVPLTLFCSQRSVTWPIILHQKETWIIVI